MLGVYQEFLETVVALAPPVGEKPAHERFPGAVATLTLEPMMQDGRALQAGTSHDLGDNFARAFEVSYQGEDGEAHPVYATSWGMSTRVIGAMLMAHGDDRGAVFPPAVAPVQVAIVPVPGRDAAATQAVDDAAATVRRTLTEAGLRVALDDRPGLRPGAKFFHWERHGAPLRLEIGPRDLAAQQATAVTRHDGEKRPVPLSGLLPATQALLQTVQDDLRARAREYQERRTRAVETREELKEAVTEGFALARWCERLECAQEIQEETRATVRCFPFERPGGPGTYAYAPAPDDPGPCAWCGTPARRRAIIARSY
jgi:prolyl-tRNA synthetase